MLTLPSPPPPSPLAQEGAIQDLDAYYEKLGNFAGIYARHVFDRMGKTVPKAIILCQVPAPLQAPTAEGLLARL